jgi:hypothetical protein
MRVEGDFHGDGAACVRRLLGNPLFAMPWTTTT